VAGVPARQVGHPEEPGYEIVSVLLLNRFDFFNNSGQAKPAVALEMGHPERESTISTAGVRKVVSGLKDWFGTCGRVRSGLWCRTRRSWSGGMVHGTKCASLPRKYSQPLGLFPVFADPRPSARNR